jgi:hypothetical protein
MEPDLSPIPDRFLPPQSQSGGIGKIARRAVMPIALVVLVVVGYQAYSWFTGNAMRREAVAAGKEPVTVPPPVEVNGLAPPASAPDAMVMDPGNIKDLSARRSLCGYLAAELERLDYEFKQPLPPPVMDRIATQIEQSRAQTSRYGCAPGNSPHTPARRRAAPAADN